MTAHFHTCRRVLLPALLLVTGAAGAQVAPTQPLAADPARAVYAPSAAQRARLQRGAAALSLPFFDDFTAPLEGVPSAQRWLATGGALVSNRLALLPLTRGAATLDGLRVNGQSYSNAISGSYGAIDSLTSQPIDLAGLTAADRVYLSFAWQAGGLVGVPNPNTLSTPVRLELFVKTDVGALERVWFQESQRRVTGFRQQVIALNQAKYLHGGFQFMFVASGNRSDNSDGWHVDYVLLDRNRAAGLADTTFQDVAISAGLRGRNASGGLNSPLRRFTAMPVWQFNAASPPTSELNPDLGVNTTNLRPGGLPLPIGVLGTVRELPAGTLLGTWRQGTKAVSGSPRQDSVLGAASRVPLPTTAIAKRLRYTLALNTQENDPSRNTLANDTIFRDVELNNYYAYDDSTAENIIALTPFNTGSAAAFAYRFDLNQPDYVGGLRLYPAFTASDRANRLVTISVWDDDAGRPANLPRATKTFTITNPLPAGELFVNITFDQPVRVTGTFYVGYSQASTGRFLHYGLDLNSSPPAGVFWGRDNNGAWNTVNLPLGRGALMMRPVMTNGVVTATVSAREAAAYSLYPNPARGTVTVAGPGFARAAVLDALGRLVWEQPAGKAGQATLALPALPAGIYLVRLTLADGRTVGRRLMLE